MIVGMNGGTPRRASTGRQHVSSHQSVHRLRKVLIRNNEAYRALGSLGLSPAKNAVCLETCLPLHARSNSAVPRQAGACKNFHVVVSSPMTWILGDEERSQETWSRRRLSLLIKEGKMRRKRVILSLEWLNRLKPDRPTAHKKL